MSKDQIIRRMCYVPWWLRIARIYQLTVCMGQEPGPSLTGSSARGLTRTQVRPPLLRVHPESHLEKNSLPSAFRLPAELTLLYCGRKAGSWLAWPTTWPAASQSEESLARQSADSLIKGMIPQHPYHIRLIVRNTLVLPALTRRQLRVWLFQGSP